jgi:DNA-binding NarL/FixJ family response regulator
MRVLLIDDHALFRIGLSELLERRGIEVIAALGGCHDALGQLGTIAPDVVLLDMRMPEMSGLEVLKQLRRDGHLMPVAMLTTSRDEQDVIASLQSGAQGYLLKDMEPDELIEALKRIVAGETLVAPELTGVLARGGRTEQQGHRPQPGYFRRHREASRQGHPAQARRAFPGGGGGAGGGAESVSSRLIGSGDKDPIGKRIKSLL